MKVFLSWLVRWACPAGTRVFGSALDALVGSNEKRNFFLIVHNFNSFVPFAQQAGLALQSCWVACLLVLVVVSQDATG
jgi:hypothetical protein